MSRAASTLALALLASACTPSAPTPLAIDESIPSATPPAESPPPAPAPAPPRDVPGSGEGTIQLGASGLVGRSSCGGSGDAEHTPLVRVLEGPLVLAQVEALAGAALPELRRCLTGQSSANDVEVTLVVEVEASGRVDAVAAQLDTSDRNTLGPLAERALERCASEITEPWRFAAAERASTFELAFFGE